LSNIKDWEDKEHAINEETEAMEQAKFSKKKYEPEWFKNGDSKKNTCPKSITAL